MHVFKLFQNCVKLKTCSMSHLQREFVPFASLLYVCLLRIVAGGADVMTMAHRKDHWPIIALSKVRSSVFVLGDALVFQKFHRRSKIFAESGFFDVGRGRGILQQELIGQSQQEISIGDRSKPKGLHPKQTEFLANSIVLVDSVGCPQIVDVLDGVHDTQSM